MVNRWLLEDGSGSKEFAFNPTSMSSPYATKSITVEGVDRSFSSMNPTIKQPTVASEWQWVGHVYTDAEKTALLSWHDKDTTFLVTDHLLRQWEVLSVNLDIAERRPTATNTSRYDYTWTVLVLRRVE